MTIAVKSELDNLIIGGDFNSNPWQRGTSFVSPTSEDYTADRFQYRVSGSQDFTITKNTDNPSKSEAGLFDTFCFQAEVTTANAAPGAGDFTTIEQPIEGFLSVPTYDNPFYMSFWVKSAVAGVFCVAFQNAARNVSYVHEYTIANADTWEEVTIQVTHDTFSGTWDIDNLAGLRVIFTLNAGSTFQGTNDIWQSGNILATANQTNLTATINNTFRIAFVAVKHGVATGSFPIRGRMTELNLCQRYYYKSYNNNDDPGTATFAGSVSKVLEGTGLAAQAHAIRFIAPEPLRITPSTPNITVFSTDSGNSGFISNISLGTDVAAQLTSIIGEREITVRPVTTPLSQNTFLSAHITVDVEI